MNIDALMSEWAERDRKLEQCIRLNTRLLRETYVEKHRDELRRLGPFAWFDIAACIPTLALLGYFLAHHLGQARFFIPALALLAWVVAFPVMGIRNREAVRDLDYGLPLVTLQAKVEGLKMERVRAFKWAFLTGQVVWSMPFLIVLFEGLFGVDLYSVSDFMPRFIAWNVVGGIVFIPIAIVASRKLGGRLGRNSAFTRFTDAIAGRDVVAAREFLARLERFEREAP